MGDHPTYEELEAFLTGDRARDESGALLLHLSGRCPECRRRLARLAGRTLGLQPAAVPPPAGLYDGAVERAFAFARRQAQGIAGGRAHLAEDLVALLVACEPREVLAGFDRRAGHGGDAGDGAGAWALAEELLTLSGELRYRDPDGMVRLAELARLVVSTLDLAPYGAGPAADLEARVHAELANAYRVADQLPAAERAMALAEARRLQGTGDLLLAARILDLKASLCSSRRRFGEALGLLRRAHAYYVELGEVHLAGRALVSRGIYAGYSGDPETALGFLLEGMALLDPARDPRVAALAEQGIVWFLVDLGRPTEARDRLARGDLRAVASDPLSRVKLGWLEGRIAQGLGDAAAAEAAFVAARESFLAAGQAYNAALVALDLAALWLAAGRTAELRPLVGELVGTFRALGIGREALAALLLLERACERDLATLDLVREVLRFLGRFQHDPSLTFAPRDSEPGS